MDSTKGILFQFLGAALAAVGILALTVSGISRGTDPRFATPRATLQSYISAVMAVDEEAELDTASKSLRAHAVDYRGPDKARRIQGLRGKMQFFKAHPMKFIEERTWGDRARIVVTQGGTPDRPQYWTYSFIREEGAWKIDKIVNRRELRW
ncbi:MAG: hypothetical protein ACYTHM_03895 [Planctomycetota bacterium]|jgi:hypothetical protein